MRKTKGTFGDRTVSVEQYPIPQRPTASNPNAALKMSSFYLTDTGLAAGVSRQWAPIPTRPLQTPIILYRINIQATKLTTALAYSSLPKLVADFQFSNPTPTFSALPAANLNNQSFTRLAFMGPPDNTQIQWDGPLKIEANNSISFNVTAYANIAAGESIIWTAQIWWSPAI